MGLKFNPLIFNGFNSSSSGGIPATEKGAPNGVATLDGTGKVPASQLPNSVMEYQGAWNASTNSPTLADGTGNLGDVYRVSVAGTQNLGSGSQTFAVGDFAIYNGSIWQHSPAGSISTPGGASNAVQFNNSGAFGGDAANFAWDNSTKRLSLGGSLDTSLLNLTIVGAANPAKMISLRSTTVGANGFGFDFNLENSATGDLQIKRVAGGASALALNVSRATGNLGIGTVATVPLDVVGSGQIAKMTAPPGQAAYMSFFSPNAGNTSTTEVRLISAVGVEGSFGTQSNHPMQIISNGTNRITLLETGLVGVNTTNPRRTLEVVKGSSGEAVLLTSDQTAGGGGVMISVGATGVGLQGTNGNLTAPLAITMQTSGGNVGIGVAPSTQFHTTGGVRFANFGAGVAQFDASGNISSTAPGTSGNVLTSNGTAWVSSATASGANLQLSNLTGTMALPVDIHWAGPGNNLTRTIQPTTTLGNQGDNVLIAGGDTTFNSAGNVTIRGGAANQTPGSLSLLGGNCSSGNGNGGNVSITAGSGVGTGAGGNILLTTSTATGPGLFKFFRTGSTVTSGQVWTSSSTDGTGYWATPSASASLSTLTDATGSNTLNNGTNLQTWNWTNSTTNAMVMTANSLTTGSLLNLTSTGTGTSAGALLRFDQNQANNDNSAILINHANNTGNLMSAITINMTGAAGRSGGVDFVTGSASSSGSQYGFRSRYTNSGLTGTAIGFSSSIANENASNICYEALMTNASAAGPGISVTHSGSPAGARGINVSMSNASGTGKAIGITSASTSGATGLDVNMSGTTGAQKAITITSPSANGPTGVDVNLQSGSGQAIGLNVTNASQTTTARGVAINMSSGASNGAIGLEVTSSLIGSNARGAKITMSATGAHSALELVQNSGTAAASGLLVTSTSTAGVNGATINMNGGTGANVGLTVTNGSSTGTGISITNSNAGTGQSISMNANAALTGLSISTAFSGGPSSQAHKGIDVNVAANSNVAFGGRFTINSNGSGATAVQGTNNGQNANAKGGEFLLTDAAATGTALTGSHSGTSGTALLVSATNGAKAMDVTGRIQLAATNTAPGTTGAQTINKASGTVNFAAGATSLVVTNSFVTANSLVFTTIRTADATPVYVTSVVPASGSFTINLSGAGPTAEISVGFFVINQ